jgi:hypothetical protein
MYNIGVGGDFFDLKWIFLNRPIAKLKDRLKELVSVSYKRMASVDTNTLFEEETNLILTYMLSFATQIFRNV